MAGPPPLFFQQARGFQDLQVLRYRGPAYGQLAGQFAYGGRPAPQEINYGLAGGVGQNAEHLHSVSHDLR